MKKFWSVPLCFCMVIPLFSPCGSAAAETDAVRVVDLTIDAPVAGGKPASSAKLPLGTSLKVTGVKWTGKFTG